MDVAVAGGHGQIALLLAEILADRGEQTRGIIRSADQQEDLRAVGSEPVVLDLEEAEPSEIADAIAGCDAAVFAAGAGPGSGAERKETVDHGAAVKLIEACQEAGVSRYVMISAMGTDDPPDGDDVFSVYLRAKARADQALTTSGLDWTILRPGRLTNEEATGRVELGRHVDRGEVPRADVAAVVAATLTEPRTSGHVFEVVSGDEEISVALERLVTDGSEG